MPSERHQLKTEFAHVHQLLCSLCKILPQCLLPKQKNGPKWHKQSCGAVKNERDEQLQGGGGEEREDSMNPRGFQSDKG